MQDDTLFNTQTILDLLRLEQAGADRFLGQSHFMGSPNVFGGQVLGQALYAALMTVQGRMPHSLHAMFILPGNHRLPIEYEVERVRDGGSFSTRRIVAVQEGKRIFVMSASFQAPEQGLEHQRQAPPAVDPESLPSLMVRWRSAGERGGRPFHPAPVDFRSEHGGDVFNTQIDTRDKRVWTRAPIALPDDEVMHLALFAYVSDYGLLPTALQPHGIRMGDPRLQIASLDHSLWIHRPFRMDQWLRFEIESPNATGGRGLCFAYVYDEHGCLVATMAQEGLIRLRQA